jgi:5-methylcytosine-specific restriction endonuclease McrA
MSGSAWKKRRKQNLIKENGAFCAYCKCELLTDSKHHEHPRYATLDHYIPKHKVRAEIPNNKILACLSCNRAKGSMMPDDFKIFLKRTRESGVKVNE